jgi:cyclic pyranopterin phosphate synthase
MQDSRPISLRVSVIDRCDERCLYCRPPEGVALVSHEEVLRLEEILRFVRFVRDRFGLAKVRLTGGEPLLRRGLAELVRGLAEMGLADLAMTTNGQRLAEMAQPLRRAGLRRVNVSLDSLDPDTYRRLTRGGDLARTLRGIAAARDAGLAPVKLNTVVLRGINNEAVVPLARFGLEQGCEVRLFELMPIGEAAAHHARWFVSSAEVRRRVAEAMHLEPLADEPGSSSGTFLARDSGGRTGRVGFVSPCSEPFCGECRRLRLTTTGRLLGCLGQRRGVDVRAALRAPGGPDEANLARAVEEALRAKSDGRRFARQDLMVRIGG